MDETQMTDFQVNEQVDVDMNDVSVDSNAGTGKATQDVIPIYFKCTVYHSTMSLESCKNKRENSVRGGYNMHPTINAKPRSGCKGCNYEAMQAASSFDATDMLNEAAQTAVAVGNPHKNKRNGNYYA